MKWAIGLIALAAIFMLAGTWAFWSFYWNLPGSWAEAPPIKHFLRQFSLAEEKVVAAWFASMLLLLAAAASLAAFMADGFNGASRRVLRLGWIVLALVFVALSFDELGSIHERVSTITNPSETVLIGWFGMMLLLASIMTFMLAFGLLHVRRAPWAFLLMLLGVICFSSIPFQEHLEMSTYRQAGSGWQRPIGWLLLEEGTELAGTICFLSSALVYAIAELARQAPGERLLTLRYPLRPALLTACGLVVFLGLGTIAIHMLVGEPRGPHGIPRNWFPATLAFVTAGLALWVAAARGVKAYGAVAMAQLVISGYFGANLYVWGFLAAPVTPVAAMAGGVFALAVVATAVFLIRITPDAYNRLGLAAWGILLLWGITATSPRAVFALLFSSSTALLFVLLMQSAHEVQEGWNGARGAPTPLGTPRSPATTL